MGLGGVTAECLERLEGTLTKRTLYCANNLRFLADSFCFGSSICFSCGLGVHRLLNLDSAAGGSYFRLGKLDGGGVDDGWLIVGVLLGF